jgi:hypothetical protein
VAGALRSFPIASLEAVTITTAPAVDIAGGQLIMTTASGLADHGAGTVAVDAVVGDRIRFYAKSGSNNFEHSVLIAAIAARGEADALADLAPVYIERVGIAPAAQAQDQLAAPSPQNFRFWQGVAAHDGTQELSLILALFDRDDEAQPRFAGLYRWDVALTVNLSAPPATEPTEGGTS